MIDTTNTINQDISSLTQMLETGKINQSEIPAQTKLEASALIDKSIATVSGMYQLDSPKVATSSDKYQQLANTIETVRPTVLMFLNTALKAFNGEQVFNSSSDAVSHIQSLMNLLFEVGKLNREQQALQRDIAANANAASLKAQAAELSHQAKTMIAMAVIAGVAAVATTAISGLTMKGAHKSLTQEKALGKELQDKSFLKAKDQSSLDSAKLSGNEALQVKAQKRLDASTESFNATNALKETQGKKFTEATSNNQSWTGVVNMIQQMLNSGINVDKANSDARSKEQEAFAVTFQTAKQKSDEQVADADNNLRELISTLHKLAEDQIAVFRATTNV